MNELLSIDSINNIIEIYGEEYFNSIISDKELLISNIKIFIKYELDYEEVFSRYPYLFLEENNNLENKLCKLIMSLGYEYKELLNEDFSLYEKITE